MFPLHTERRHCFISAFDNSENRRCYNRWRWWEQKKIMMILIWDEIVCTKIIIFIVSDGNQRDEAGFVIWQGCFPSFNLFLKVLIIIIQSVIRINNYNSKFSNYLFYVILNHAQDNRWQKFFALIFITQYPFSSNL